MKLPNSTYKILVAKYLDIPIDSKWIDWSIEMLEHGFDTENLRIMAGMSEKEGHFALSQYAENIIRELNLDPSDYKLNLRGYVHYLYEQIESNKLCLRSALRELRNLHWKNNYDGELSGFYLLYYALEDLQDSTQQGYVPGANRANIESIIKNYFQLWFISEDKSFEIPVPDRPRIPSILERFNIFSMFRKK